MSAAPAPSVVLRTAAVWGSTVLAVRNLGVGQSFVLGEGDSAIVPKPDNSAISDLPVRAVGTGWELDARGATGGVLHIRGRQENPVELAQTGAPIPIVAGDHGLLQYGNFSVFFQFTPAPPVMAKPKRFDWAVLFAFMFSLAFIGGGLTVFALLSTPPDIDKPLELVSRGELARRLNMDLEEITPPEAGDDEKGKGIEDPGAKDKKEQGGGKKIAGKEGSLGRQGKEDETKQTGEPAAGLGGMSEVLASDVGEEVQKTLGTISSVAEALGGLRSDSIVLGRGPGTGFKGSGPGGGGDGPGGVPFGSGTLETGWGPGKGGGYGRGRGGPGGRGKGGRGKGGSGDGKGSGTGGERKVKGKGGGKKGQGLTPAQISRVVMSRYGAFRACYESAAARNPSLQGSVSVSWSITPGGSVGGASLGGSSLGNGRVEGCILRQFRRLRFPTADKPTNAGWTFSFKPSKK